MKKAAVLILAFALLVTFAAVPVAAEARAVHVYAGESIQAAVNAARPGAIIIVHEGTYYGSITIWKELTLIGSGATISAIAGPSSWGVRVIAGGVRISGFTIGYAAGAGILVAGSFSGCRIDNNKISLCSTGINITSTSEVDIRNNEVQAFGNAIYANSSSEISVKDNAIYAGLLSGIQILKSSNVEVKGNTVFTSSTAISFSEVSNVTVKDNILRGRYYGVSIFGMPGVPTVPSPNVVVTNNTVFTSYASPTLVSVGIFVGGVSEAEVKGNGIFIGANTDPSSTGISLGFSTGSTIGDNSVSGDFMRGIAISGGIVFSTANKVIDNVIAGGSRTGDIGIYFNQFTSGNSAVNNTISGVSIPILDVSGENTILP